MSNRTTFKRIPTDRDFQKLLKELEKQIESPPTSPRRRPMTKILLGFLAALFILMVLYGIGLVRFDWTAVLSIF